jgi:hypothetical protein
MNPFPANHEINPANGQPSTTHARSARAVAAGSGLSKIQFRRRDPWPPSKCSREPVTWR